MEVATEPINPQASDADTIGNLTYIEGDVLDVLSVTSQDVAASRKKITYYTYPSESVA